MDNAKRRTEQLPYHYDDLSIMGGRLDKDRH